MLYSRNNILTVQYDQNNNNNMLLSSYSSLNNTIMSMTTLNGGNELIRKKTTKNGKAFLLPPELLLEVFYYLSDCQSALYAASLVCKQWFYCVAPILYSHPQIKDTYHWATLILTLTRERMSFFYGDLIRSIDLSSGKSIEAMKDQEFYRRLSDITDRHRHSLPISLMHHPNLQRNRRQQHYYYLRNRRGHFEEEHYYHESSNEQEYSMKGLPFIIVSTSSLIQLSRTCKNLTSLNLSYTTLLYDSLIAETGEYLSTLQHYAIQPGLTHIQIPIEEAIQTIGNECHQLTEVKIQRCEWVTAHVIWMFAYYCTNLKRLDARRSTKCTVKRLISHVLEEQPILHHSPPPPHPSSFIVLPASSLSTSTGSNTSHEFEEEEEEDNTHIQINDSMTVHFRFNEESGLYEQIEMPTVNTGLIYQREEEEDDNDEIVMEEELIDNNSHLRFVTLNDEMQQSTGHHRPTQPTEITHHYKSLKEIIYNIIVDARELGVIDLHWLQDY